MSKLNVSRAIVNCAYIQLEHNECLQLLMLNINIDKENVDSPLTINGINLTVGENVATTKPYKSLAMDILREYKDGKVNTVTLEEMATNFQSNFINGDDTDEDNLHKFITSVCNCDEDDILKHITVYRKIMTFKLTTVKKFFRIENYPLVVKRLGSYIVPDSKSLDMLTLSH